jgi:hypothetical protein
MNEKVQENLQKWLDAGYSRAKEDEDGYPVVYKQQYVAGRIVSQERYVVKESVTPDSVAYMHRELVPGPNKVEPIE